MSMPRPHEKGKPAQKWTHNQGQRFRTILRWLEWKGLEGDNILGGLHHRGIDLGARAFGRAPNSREDRCGHQHSISDSAAPSPFSSASSPGATTAEGHFPQSPAPITGPTSSSPAATADEGNPPSSTALTADSSAGTAGKSHLPSSAGSIRTRGTSPPAATTEEGHLPASASSTD